MYIRTRIYIYSRYIYMYLCIYSYHSYSFKKFQYWVRAKNKKVNNIYICWSMLICINFIDTHTYVHTMWEEKAHHLM